MGQRAHVIYVYTSKYIQHERKHNKHTKWKIRFVYRSLHTRKI